LKPINTTKEVSRQIGISHDTLYKASVIQEEKSKLTKESQKFGTRRPPSPPLRQKLHTDCPNNF
jgi:transposase-like protein